MCVEDCSLGATLATHLVWRLAGVCASVTLRAGRNFLLHGRPHCVGWQHCKEFQGLVEQGICSQGSYSHLKGSWPPTPNRATVEGRGLQLSPELRTGRPSRAWLKQTQTNDFGCFFLAVLC